MNPKLMLALLVAAIATGVGTSLRPGSPVPQVLDSSGSALSSSLTANSQPTPSNGGTSAIEFPTTTTAGGSPFPSTTTTAAGVAAQGAQGGYMVTNQSGVFPTAPNAGPYTGYYVPGFTGNPGAPLIPGANPGGAVQGLKGF